MSPRSTRLHVVTGKGGTGKTTVAVGLALALAAQGRRVLVAEVEGRQGIAAALGVPDLGTAERVVADLPRGGVLYGLAVDARTSLAEYLAQVARLGPASALLERTGAVDLATSIAPGLRDVLLVGKVYEAVRRTEAHQRTAGAASYDAVVLDAPPTGRVGRFLGAGGELADLAKVGPLHAQAQAVARTVREEGAVHVVTLLEEMPVRETVEGVADLRAHDLPVASVVVNRRRTEVESDADLAALIGLDDGSVSTDDVARALPGLPPAAIEALVGLGRTHLARLAQEDELVEELAPLRLPLLDLPELPTGGRLERADLLGLGSLVLDGLGEQGLAPGDGS